MSKSLGRNDSRSNAASMNPFDDAYDESKNPFGEDDEELDENNPFREDMICDKNLNPFA